MLRKRFFGVLAVLVGVVLAFVLAGCGDGNGGGGPLEGTWIDTSDTYKFIFSGPNYVQEYKSGGTWENAYKGTFSLNAAQTEITFTQTHSWSSTWDVDADVSTSISFTISGNSFTVNFGGTDETFTKQ